MTPTLTPAELDELAALEREHGNGWFADARFDAERSGGKTHQERGKALLRMVEALPALLAMARRLGELQYRWGEFSASNLANLHSLNAQLTAATARAEAADAKLAEVETWVRTLHGRVARGDHGTAMNLSCIGDAVFSARQDLSEETTRADTADARAQAAEKRCGDAHDAMVKFRAWVVDVGFSGPLTDAELASLDEMIAALAVLGELRRVAALPAKPGGVKP